MSSDPIIVTRDLVKRGWSDFEPKVVAGGITGSIGAFLIPLAAGFGIHLSLVQANYLCVAIFFIGAYLTPSAGTKVISTTTKGNSDVVRSETHSGNSVTTATASTPVQQPATGSPQPSVPLPDEPVAAPRPFIWGVDTEGTADNQATRVIQ